MECGGDNFPRIIVCLFAQGVESTFVTYDRYKYRSRAQLQMIPADEPILTSVNFDAVTTITQSSSLMK